jgi:hypothetical protein
MDRDDLDHPALWRATVPVFDRILGRLSNELARAAGQLGPGIAAALALRPAPGMMPAAQQIASAAQFTLRTAFPLAQARPPEVRGALDAEGLAGRIAETRRLLAAIDPAAFLGAETRITRGQAGFATVELPGDAFLRDFGLPNIYFHHAMAHVALKIAGAQLGKADYDGLHLYPEGFSFG